MEAGILQQIQFKISSIRKTLFIANALFSHAYEIYPSKLNLILMHVHKQLFIALQFHYFIIWKKLIIRIH